MIHTLSSQNNLEGLDVSGDEKTIFEVGGELGPFVTSFSPVFSLVTDRVPDSSENTGSQLSLYISNDHSLYITLCKHLEMYKLQAD